MIDDPETKRRFAGLMTGMSDYYRQEISKEVLSIYFKALRQFEFEDVVRATEAHMLNPDTAGSFMPKVNELAKMIQGSTTDQSALAWSKAEGAVVRVGPYQDVAFDDPIIHRVIADLGGWLWLCAQDDKAWPFIGNDFKTRYKGYRMRGETPEYQPVLIGAANAHNGIEAPAFRFKPVLIGDQEKCAQVMKSGSTAPLISMKPAADSVKLL